RRRHTRLQGDWSSDVCSSDLDLGIGTHPFPSKTIGIRAQAPVIGVGTGLALGRFATDRFPVEGIPTLLTMHQALQHIARPSAGRSEERRVGKEWNARQW